MFPHPHPPLFVRYMCRLSDDELRIAGNRSMTELVWHTVKEVPTLDSHHHHHHLHHPSHQHRGGGGALWSGSTKNTDVSTEALARPFALSLTPLTHLLAPHYSLRSHAPPRSLPRWWDSE